MNALSLIIKFAVITGVISFASGSMKDVLMGTFDSVKIKAAYAQMSQLHGKLVEYRSLNNSYPRSQNELCGFLTKEFDTPLEKVLIDPWGKSYFFLSAKFEILCFGPDKTQKTKDDFGHPYPASVLGAARGNSMITPNTRKRSY
jgi:Type II secretion system (T2SS), protein G